MDCSIFRKRLNDLVEENIEFDLRGAMLNHIEKCQSCRSLYEEELKTEEEFRKAFSVDTGNFRSLRYDIMKNIDKNRYNKSSFNKVINHFKKYKANYAAFAAATAAVIIISPYISKQITSFGSPKLAVPQVSMKTLPSSDKTAEGSLENKYASIRNSDEATIMTKSDSSVTKKGTAVQDTIYLPSFEKKALEKGFQVSFNIPWELSPSGKYSATVEGLGVEAYEEGIGYIVLKDEAGKQWSFKLIDNEEKQYTPKKLKWIDDENLLITVGFGQGMVQKGGDLYILNVITDKITKPNPNKIEAGALSEVTKIISVEKFEKNKLRINVELQIYEDANLSISRMESGTIVTDAISK